MKKIISLILAMIAISLPMLADDSNNNVDHKLFPIFLEANLTASTPYKGSLPFSSVLDLNYKIKRFSLHALIDGTYFLPKENMTKNYNKTFNLGGGIGFELFPEKENERNVFEVRASVTRSLGSSEYRNTAYKIGLQWLVRPYKRCLTPSIGVGYCLRSFSAKELSTYNGLYVTLGIRF